MKKVIFISVFLAVLAPFLCHAITIYNGQSFTIYSGGQLSEYRGAEEIAINWTSDEHFLSTVLDDPDAEGAVLGSSYFYTAAAKLRQFVDLSNAKQVDFAVSTGDMVNENDSFSEYFAIWENLQMPNRVVIGNHDRSVPIDDIASVFGYETTLAGSKFNAALSLQDGAVGVRVLIVDTTNQEAGSSYVGRCPLNVRNWIAGELAGCTENIVLMFMHHGPHKYDTPTSQFIEADALALRDVVDAAVVARPGLVVRAFFGHAHGNARVESFKNLGVNFIGYMVPPLVTGVTTTFATIYVYADGTIRFGETQIGYPYP